MPHAIRAGLLAATLAIAAGPCSADVVCSALSRHPCVYHPYHQLCSVFSRRGCTYEPSYPFTEQLQLTIYSRPATDRRDTVADGTPPAERPELHTIGDVFATLRQCWVPPGEDVARPGTQLTVRLSFKRNGDLFGNPRISYATPKIPAQVRQTYWDAIMATLERCTPLQLGKGLGGALAGRPFAIRFVDDRDKS